MNGILFHESNLKTKHQPERHSRESGNLIIRKSYNFLSFSVPDLPTLFIGLSALIQLSAAVLPLGG